jgi:hypothetical protein
MISSQWAYPSEKFAVARRILMAPHPNGEAKSFVAAFHECQHGLRSVSNSDLDYSARSWVATITATLDTTGIDDPSGHGTWIIKAESLGVEEMSRFSDAVSGLADWFHARFHGHD